jgi:hypothetical protein
MDPKSSEALKELLRGDVERLSHEALQNSGRLSQAQVDGIANLAKLIEIRKSLEPPKPADFFSRWAMPLLLVGTLAIATLLLFAHVRSTEIELDMHASEIEFRLASDTEFVESMDLTSLGVDHVQSIAIRRTAAWPGLDLTAPEGESLNLKMTALGKKETSTVTLASLRAKAGSLVSVQAGHGGEGPVQVSLEGAEVQVSLLGTIQLAGNRVEPRTVEFDKPRPAEFRAGKSIITLQLTVRDAASIRLAPQIDINGLSFYHLDEQSRPLSSIISGSLYFGALNGAQEQLRRGQELRLGELRGRIRAIELRPEPIALQFSGSAGKLETGSYQNSRTLMPAWLDWLRARHGLFLLWGTATYVSGLLSAALRWLRESHGSLKGAQ